MRAQGGGKLVHIGSRSGFEGEPGVSVYSASKFTVAGISEALSAELAPFGVRSMVVEPDVFRTDFLDRSSLSLPENRIAAYDGTPAHTTVDWACPWAATPSTARKSRSHNCATTWRRGGRCGCVRGRRHGHTRTRGYFSPDFGVGTTLVTLISSTSRKLFTFGSNSSRQRSLP